MAESSVPLAILRHARPFGPRGSGWGPLLPAFAGM